MKFRYLISLAVATALLTGCNNEDDFGTKVTNGMLRATMESNASGMARAGFDANGAFYWSEGDRLGVTMQDGAVMQLILIMTDTLSQRLMVLQRLLTISRKSTAILK